MQTQIIKSTITVLVLCLASQTSTANNNNITFDVNKHSLLCTDNQNTLIQKYACTNAYVKKQLTALHHKYIYYIQTDQQNAVAYLQLMAETKKSLLNINDKIQCVNNGCMLLAINKLYDSLTNKYYSLQAAQVGWFLEFGHTNNEINAQTKWSETQILTTYTYTIDYGSSETANNFIGLGYRFFLDKKNKYFIDIIARHNKHKDVTLNTELEKNTVRITKDWLDRVISTEIIDTQKQNTDIVDLSMDNPVVLNIGIIGRKHAFYLIGGIKNLTYKFSNAFRDFVDGIKSDAYEGKEQITFFGLGYNYAYSSSFDIGISGMSASTSIKPFSYTSVSGSERPIEIKFRDVSLIMKYKF